VTCHQRMLTPPRHLTQYTSDICRGPRKPDFYCGLLHLPDLDTDLECRYSVYLTRHTDLDCGLFRFPDLDTPILTIEFFVSNGAYGGCVRSTGDAYSLTPDPTSGLSRGPCLLNFLDLYLYGIYETDHCSLYYFFILMGKKTMTVWCQRRRYT
jgi:hypothetical protein